MKKYILLAFPIICAFNAVCQIELEHTYPKGSVERRNLDVSGEKYTLTVGGPLYSGVTLKVFNADHTDSGTSFTFFTGGSHSVVGAISVSEKILDNDPEIELLVPWMYNTENVFGTRLFQESGESQELCTTASISSLIGYPHRLSCGRQFYDLPSFQFLHDFSNIGCTNSNCFIARKELPIGGERYFVKPGNSNTLYAYDGAFNLVNIFSLPFTDAHNRISQTLFNDDALFEFYGLIGTTPDALGNNYLFQIIQDNGAVLFSEQCMGAGLTALSPQKIVIRKFIAPSQIVTEVLDIKTFEPLLTLNGAFISLAADDKLFYRTPFEPDNSFTLYNPSTQTFKTVSFPFPPKSNTEIQYAANRFSADGLLEILYKTEVSPGNFGYVWMNENGQVLQSFDGARSATIDKTAGFEPKLLVRYGSPVDDSTQVYRFVTPNTNVSTVLDEPLITVRPNPFVDYVDIHFPKAGSYELHLFTAAGQLVTHNKVAVLEASNVKQPFQNGLPPGIYVLYIKGDTGSYSFRLVK